MINFKIIIFFIFKNFKSEVVDNLIKIFPSEKESRKVI